MEGDFREKKKEEEEGRRREEKNRVMIYRSKELVVL